MSNFKLSTLPEAVQSLERLDPLLLHDERINRTASLRTVRGTKPEYGPVSLHAFARAYIETYSDITGLYDPVRRALRGDK